jgi:amidase
MALLEPGFTAGDRPAARLGRLRRTSEQVDPRIDAAIDAALARAGLKTIEVELPEWPDALMQAYLLTFAEAADVNAAIMADPVRAASIGADVRAQLEQGQGVTADQVRTAREFQSRWQSEWTALLSSVDAVVLATVPFFPPPLAEASQHHYTGLTAPVNVAGLPALALPVPAGHRLPASMQVVGPPRGEELLLATGAVLEEAAGYRR